MSRSAFWECGWWDGGGDPAGARGWGPGLIPQLRLERLLAPSQNRRSVLHPRGLQGRGDFSDVAVKQGRSAQAGGAPQRGLDLGEGPPAWPAGGLLRSGLGRLPALEPHPLGALGRYFFHCGEVRSHPVTGRRRRSASTREPSPPSVSVCLGELFPSCNRGLFS